MQTPLFWIIFKAETFLWYLQWSLYIYFSIRFPFKTKIGWKSFQIQNNSKMCFQNRCCSSSLFTVQSIFWVKFSSVKRKVKSELQSDMPFNHSIVIICIQWHIIVPTNIISTIVWLWRAISVQLICFISLILTSTSLFRS